MKTKVGGSGFWDCFGHQSTAWLMIILMEEVDTSIFPSFPIDKKA
jgi:hypothetical protein